MGKKEERGLAVSAIIIAAICISVLLAGCGSSSSTETGPSSTNPAAGDNTTTDGSSQDGSTSYCSGIGYTLTSVGGTLQIGDGSNYYAFSADTSNYSGTIQNIDSGGWVYSTYTNSTFTDDIKVGIWLLQYSDGPVVYEISYGWASGSQHNMNQGFESDISYLPNGSCDAINSVDVTGSFITYNNNLGVTLGDGYYLLSVGVYDGFDPL